jgi:hypothetical protein
VIEGKKRALLTGYRIELGCWRHIAVAQGRDLGGNYFHAARWRGW